MIRICWIIQFVLNIIITFKAYQCRDLSARILGWIENNSNIFIQQGKTKLINPVDGILFLLVRFSFSIFYLPIASSVLFFISVAFTENKKLRTTIILFFCSELGNGGVMKKIIPNEEMDFLFVLLTKRLLLVLISFCTAALPADAEYLPSSFSSSSFSFHNSGNAQKKTSFF